MCACEYDGWTHWFAIHIPLSYFVQLQCRQTRHNCCRCGNSRYNFASNQFGRMSVGCLDFIVGSTEIGTGDNVVHVEICVVILFEFDWCNFEF